MLAILRKKPVQIALLVMAMIAFASI